MKDVVSLTSGDPNFETPEHIKEAAIESIKKGFTHYTPISGIEELREAITNKLSKENDIDARADTEVMITSGAMGGIFAVTQAFINPGDMVLVADPDFPVYSECVKMAGGIPISLPREEHDSFSLDPCVLRKFVTSKTKMIIFSNPNNPTGSVMNKETLEELAEVSKEKKLIVVSDEAYEKILYDGYRHHSIASLPGMKSRTISIFSFSKTYAMTGWRIGYAAASKELIKAMSKISYCSVGCPQSTSQMAALAALTGPQNCVKAMVKEYRRRRDLLLQNLSTLDAFKIQKPGGAFYLFPNIKHFHLDDSAFAEKLLYDAKVAVVPGRAFGATGHGYIRISYSYSTQSLLEGIKRIKEYLNNARTALSE